jgi:hypothetical protein
MAVPAVKETTGGRSTLAEFFAPPPLPTISRSAFRFHLAHTLLYAIFEGIMGNVPLIAVKAMNATDAQLQLPLAMTSLGLFASVFLGAFMATRRKKPFVLVPGFAAGLTALAMAWASSAMWFLGFAGVISILDFAMRPAVPSIVRSVYPDHCRSHLSGTMRQWSSIVFLGATLASSILLSAAEKHIYLVIRIEIAAAGLACLGAFLCFWRLPDRGDGSKAEADPAPEPSFSAATLSPLLDRRFRRYLAVFFVFSFGNLFQQGVVPALFSHNMGLGYVQSTLLIHIIPNLAAFLSGGRLAAWFEHATIWRSYALVTLLWGLDPIILAIAGSSLILVVLGRIARGPATLGSMVIAFFTGVHSFAPPGGDTTRYMSAFFLVNGVARLAAPCAAAFAVTFASRQSVLLWGGLAIMLSSLMFWWNDRREAREERTP